MTCKHTPAINEAAEHIETALNALALAYRDPEDKKVPLDNITHVLLDQTAKILDFKMDGLGYTGALKQLVAVALELIEDFIEEEYQQSKIYAEIERLIAVAIEDPKVKYAAFDYDEEGYVLNDLGRTAIDGKVVVRAKHDEFWGKGKDYESKPVANPTWLDLAVLADEQIKTTGDYSHIFFEDVIVKEEKDGIKYVQLFMGS